MRISNADDTIVAISTPIGEGGIGIVRLSGEDALKIIDRLFVPKNGRKPSQMKSHSIQYGHIVDDSHIIDEALITVMKRPRTYTREDIVEINCHGGVVPLKMLLELCVKNGCRIAQPGEFTKRAFLNGRIDLAQAEAVSDFIRAKTELAGRVSLNQLEGALSRDIEVLKNNLTDILANVEASIDFPEEELPTLTHSEISNRIIEISNKIERLLKTFHYGVILRDGITITICGKPNVGKSSLLNALLRQNRAIVTDIPGTTRDTIEETVNIHGIPVRLVDTAGIAKTNSLVELEGVERSRSAIDRADLVILVLDSSSFIQEEDKEILEVMKDKKAIVCLNKIDLPLRIETGLLSTYLDSKPLVRISCLTNQGIEELKEDIRNAIWNGQISVSDEVIVTNIRHQDALKRCLDSLHCAINSVRAELPLEFISIELRESLDSLGEITGEVVTEDILNRIFSNFCIGK